MADKQNNDDSGLDALRATLVSIVVDELRKGGSVSLPVSMESADFNQLKNDVDSWIEERFNGVEDRLNERLGEIEGRLTAAIPAAQKAAGGKTKGVQNDLNEIKNQLAHIAAFLEGLDGNFEAPPVDGEPVADGKNPNRRNDAVSVHMERPDGEQDNDEDQDPDKGQGTGGWLRSNFGSIDFSGIRAKFNIQNVVIVAAALVIILFLLVYFRMLDIKAYSTNADRNPEAVSQPFDPNTIVDDPAGTGENDAAGTPPTEDGG